MKILIVDDSYLLRNILKAFMESHGFTVVEARHGQEAIEMNLHLQPDIIVMDIKMPVMDGIEATRKIMLSRPVPIVVFSQEIDANAAFEALQSGAVEIMNKPNIDYLNDGDFQRCFVDKLRSLVRSASNANTGSAEKSYGIVVMGASTGGPVALKKLLGELPKTFPLGIALVQHLEKGFEQGFADWLDSDTPLSVRLASPRDRAQPGEVVVAPVDRHLCCREGELWLEDGPKVLNQKPSIDVLFESAAGDHRHRVIAVLLTGMGEDGARGCLKIKENGGHTIVQDQASCAIFGMPKKAIELKGASRVLALDQIARHLLELVVSP